ncbi:precorrin-2 C(20)-methyltransferase [Rhizosaccharibacter radicis]|uniref:Precorrin-2 C(20)-methyltransferase n=1 Tax=Rhizosaccharibacter radicis TaxID=2782605 RepID=A0ABT1VZZ9_9PROT|nr:precorrin-2 C(20)-methyltransferase [Acetobacteraceae bacterium KSS12]
MTDIPMAAGATSRPGTLHVLGMGPGDPELVTAKALRILSETGVVAFFAKQGRVGHARGIAGDRIRAGAVELRLEYPFTTEVPVSDPRYLRDIGSFYEDCAARLSRPLAAGQDVALLCEGDPFFYGSSMYLFDRLSASFPHQVVPGVTGMSGCWTAAGLPITHGDDVLSVLPGTLPEEVLTERLRHTDAAVIMKVGRNLPRIVSALRRAGLGERAVYVERGTQATQRLLSLEDAASLDAPYFSMILVPGRQRPR